MSPTMSMSSALIVSLLFLASVCAEDYYDLLGVGKDADNRDIRRAFKKLALKMHPDKNANDENAHENFIKINKAYEVLKDEEMRKKYDLYGEEGLKDDFGKSWKGNYQSWNYYYESFGIYDDDPEIITLSRLDFEQSVLGSPDIWFLNFYSPQCSHCHHLAPSWRKMARELEGVIRIGAVNCEEDWMLCRQQNIYSYPSLILYPQKEKYKGSRETEDLVEYVLKILPEKIIEITSKNYESLAARPEFQERPWLLFVCKNREDCFFDDTVKKLSIILDGLVFVGTVDVVTNEKTCDMIDCESSITYYEKFSTPSKPVHGHTIDQFEKEDILKEVLKLLPGVEELTENKFSEMQETLNLMTSQPWLIEFCKSADDSDASENTELKRLRAFLSNVRIGRINCQKQKSACSKWILAKYPVFVLFRPGGSHEFHYGRFTAHDIATFVRESLSSKVETLSPENFPAVISSDQPWFIDFFAPWCPPCMQLLPEWRKASRVSGHLVKFGTVDCTVHAALCTKYNIRSYPTTILYNQSRPHQFHGSHTQRHLTDFVEDTLHPSVISLDSESFEKLVGGKMKEDMWAVDFFAPWCSPCQQLAPQWRKLAKMLKHDSSIHVAQVDCTVHSSLCQTQNVNSYPTIRLYPIGKKGSSKFYFYNGWNRDAQSLQAWIYSFLPSKVQSLGSSDFRKILSDSTPWLVDFYAPWCGHCQTFAPEFEKVAQVVNEESLKVGKVNCEELPGVCNSAEIAAYPTLVLYSGKKGTIVQDPVGERIQSLTYEGIIAYIKDHLGMKLKMDMKNQKFRDEL